MLVVLAEFEFAPDVRDELVADTGHRSLDIEQVISPRQSHDGQGRHIDDVSHRAIGRLSHHRGVEVVSARQIRPLDRASGMLFLELLDEVVEEPVKGSLQTLSLEGDLARQRVQVELRRLRRSRAALVATFPTRGQSDTCSQRSAQTEVTAPRNWQRI